MNPDFDVTRFHSGQTRETVSRRLGVELEAIETQRRCIITREDGPEPYRSGSIQEPLGSVLILTAGKFRAVSDRLRDRYGVFRDLCGE